jgi:hypothetical protein
MANVCLWPFSVYHQDQIEGNLTSASHSKAAARPFGYSTSAVDPNQTPVKEKQQVGRKHQVFIASRRNDCAKLLVEVEAAFKQLA